MKKTLSEKDYRNIFGKVPRLCVDLLILVGGKIVLTKRKIAPYKNRWHLPGGRMLYKESIQEATARIMRAELGIKITTEPRELVGYMEFPRDGGFVHSVSLVFVIRISQESADNIKIDEQATAHKLFSSLPGKMHPVHGKFITEHVLYDFFG